MHAPTSVVNGEDCVFPADTLPNFGGMMVRRERRKRTFSRAEDEICAVRGMDKM